MNLSRGDEACERDPRERWRQSAPGGKLGNVCGRGGIMGMGKDVCLWCGASRVRCAVVNLFMTHGRDKKVSERQLSDLCWSSCRSTMTM